MAKKTTTQKSAKSDAKSNADVTIEKPVAKAATKKPAAKKPAKAKSPTARTRVKAAAVTPAASASITPADIALRAYFISEKRQKLGIPGDSTSDWVEAERQLKVEAKAKL